MIAFWVGAVFLFVVLVVGFVRDLRTAERTDERMVDASRLPTVVIVRVDRDLPLDISRAIERDRRGQRWN